LRARLLAVTEPKAAHRIIKRLLDEEENADIDLYFEILHFLSVEGDKYLFEEAFNKYVQLIESEEDLQDLLHISLDYTRTHGRDKNVEAIQAIIQERQARSLNEKLDKKTPILEILKKFIS
jgi:hypothetical protein